MCAMERIRVLIVDDHQVVRMGLAAILSPAKGFEVIGEAGDGRQAIQVAQELNPDVILMDLLMPEVDGLEAVVSIKARNPAARILVLTSFDEQDRISAIMAAGASGYLLKDSSADELIQAIRSVHSGFIVMPPAVMQAISGASPKEKPGKAGVDALTPREIEILRGIVDGLTNQAIAVKLGISSTTVRSHVSAILAKLNVSNRTQAAMVARERGLV